MNVKEKCNVPFELPSKVRFRKFIRMPKNGNVVENDDEWSRCGKWIVHFLDDHTQDRAWIEMHTLIENGTLLMIKASTVKIAHEGLVILCYTSPEKSRILEAAIAIQRIASDKFFALLYKTNETTERGVSDIGSGNEDVIHKFLYTPKEKFYEKDDLQRWTLVTDEKNPAERGILGEPLKEKTGVSLLSAYTAHEESFRLSQGHLLLQGYWSMKCDFTYKDETGQTEMERVQDAAKKLFKEGVFLLIERQKTRENFSTFNFYIKEAQDKKEVLTYAMKLRHAIYYPHAIYFYDVHRRINAKFMHFADGEFFEFVGLGIKSWKAVILE